MSHERVLKVLINLGLTRRDARVYVHLAKHGPQKVRNIVEALKMQEQHLYRCLRSLKNKRIVDSTIERTAEFSAIPFDKALELLINAHLKESRNIEQEKEEILNEWYSMISRIQT
ncbi:MAG TPA: helix-turn-helix domain-containing protein [Candidatus Sulfotelmatobacter sp.]|nr:helix-turn-helix domain-containing protein [Candidatus Sulfotelmatobacter sp.]